MRRRDLMALLGGAAVLSPGASRARPKAIPEVGVLSPGRSISPAFAEGLSDSGYYDGRNVALVYATGTFSGGYGELPAMAADLVRRKVAVIAAFGSAAALAAKRATSTIPVVFESGDPVAEGLVASLARPGGNLTGVSFLNAELMPKRLQLLAEMAPRARRFALLVNAAAAAVDTVIARTREAARAMKVQLLVLKSSSTYGAIDTAFATLARRDAEALVVDLESFPRGGMRGYLTRLASHRHIPTIYSRNFAASEGGLLSYGPDVPTTFRQLGVYAGRILKGERPADLPVEQPARLELVINRKAAKALGLTVPSSLLTLADTVIQ